MNGFADFSFYQDIFHGNAIPTLEEFLPAAREATAYINKILMGNLPDPSDTAFVSIKYATCAVAEVVHADSESMGQTVASESVGNHSRTYARKSESERNRDMFKAAYLYLPSALLPSRSLR